MVNKLALKDHRLEVQGNEGGPGKKSQDKDSFLPKINVQGNLLPQCGAGFLAWATSVTRDKGLFPRMGRQTSFSLITIFFSSDINYALDTSCASFRTLKTCLRFSFISLFSKISVSHFFLIFEFHLFLAALFILF